MQQASIELWKAQRRYKRKFDKELCRTRRDFEEGEFVFITKEIWKSDQPRHKLAPIAYGPFKVTACNGETAAVQTQDLLAKISHDRVEWAPSPLENAEPSTDKAAFNTRVGTHTVASERERGF